MCMTAAVFACTGQEALPKSDASRLRSTLKRLEVNNMFKSAEFLLASNFQSVLRRALGFCRFLAGALVCHRQKAAKSTQLVPWCENLVLAAISPK